MTSLRIVRAGPEAAGLAERPLESLAGMSLIAAFGSAPLDAVARQAVTSDEATTGEADLGHLGARHFVVDAVPLTAGGLVLFLHDVTALRRMERVRRDFVANISHELRTPLTSIKLLAETLTSGAVDDPATTRDFATQIEREVDHLAQLVDELLDLSMIESGATTLSIEALDPETVVAACVERITPGRRASRDHRPPLLAARHSRRSRARRSGKAEPGAPQPRPQRRQVQPPRRRGPDRLGGDRRSGSVHRRRRWHRHPGRAPGAHLRALLQGRPLACPRPGRRAARRQRRARPGDRPPHRRGAPRLGRGQLRGRCRLDVLDRGPASRRLGLPSSRCCCRQAASAARGSRRRRAGRRRRW